VSARACDSMEQVAYRRCGLTLAMAVSIGWGLFLVELVALVWLVARHNR
jgi:hypothetical protein